AFPFGGETDEAIDLATIERFDADVVAGGKAVTCFHIVDHEGENSIKPLHAEGTPSNKGLKHNFGVAGRLKGTTKALQLNTQFAMIIDFTIHDDHSARSRIDNRLLGLIPIHDGEPICAHRCVIEDEALSKIVSVSSMPDRAKHVQQCSFEVPRIALAALR